MKLLRWPMHGPIPYTKHSTQLTSLSFISSPTNRDEIQLLFLEYSRSVSPEIVNYRILYFDVECIPATESTCALGHLFTPYETWNITDKSGSH